MSDTDGWQVPFSRFEIYEAIFVPAMMGEWAPRAMALAVPQPGERVLDVACGPGALTRLAAEAVGSSGRVVGFDLKADVLEAARKTTPDRTVAAPIEWCEGDACLLPFDSETFEVVFCSFGLMSFSDRPAALREMRRVLVPGGRLAATVWGPMNKCPGQMAMKASWERHAGPDNPGLATQRKMHSLADIGTVRSLVFEAGFRDATIQTDVGSVRFPSAECLVRSFGALTGIEADAETRARVIEEVRLALQAYVGAEGLVYPIEAILVSALR